MSDQRDEFKQLYGTGWQFPIGFDTPDPGQSRSTLQMSAGTDNVAQSLSLLFQTQPGERIMLPYWGCDLHSTMFENMSEGALSALQSRISESVARYESRAEAVTVDVQQDTVQPGLLRIAVTYRLSGQIQQITGQINVFDSTEAGGGGWLTQW